MPFLAYNIWSLLCYVVLFYFVPFYSGLVSFCLSHTRLLSETKQSNAWKISKVHIWIHQIHVRLHTCLFYPMSLWPSARPSRHPSFHPSASFFHQCAAYTTRQKMRYHGGYSNTPNTSIDSKQVELMCEPSYLSPVPCQETEIMKCPPHGAANPSHANPRGSKSGGKRGIRDSNQQI